MKAEKEVKDPTSQNIGWRVEKSEY